MSLYANFNYLVLALGVAIFTWFGAKVIQRDWLARTCIVVLCISIVAVLWFGIGWMNEFSLIMDRVGAR